MSEIKARTSVIEACNKGAFGLSEMAAYEFCHLELRMICELIALGCIAVHGDVPGTRSSEFRKRREADWIVKALEKLHPLFYPVPAKLITDQNGTLVDSEIITNGFLSKDALVKLYHECGGVLHRGGFEKLDALSSPGLGRVESWVKQIGVLLNHHKIHLKNGQELWVRMVAGDRGAVRASLMTWVDVPHSSPETQK